MNINRIIKPAWKKDNRPNKTGFIAGLMFLSIMTAVMIAGQLS